MISSNLFVESSSPEKIITKIKNGEWIDILNSLCIVKDNLVILDNIYFKYFAAKETYNIILSHVINNIDSILATYDGFIIHINIKGLTVSDIDKHYKFIQNISMLFKEKYPNKLTKCFIYNPPFGFAQIFNMISLFIDKDTQSKIELVLLK